MIRKTIIVVLTLATIGTGALWIVGWTVQGPEFRKFDAGTGVSHVIQCGTVGYHLEVTRGTLSFQISKRRPATKPAMRKFGFAGFGVELYTRTMPPWGPSSNWLVHLPLWALLTLFASYPTIALIRRPLRRRRRRRKGQCLKCGYDLTGNESGKCPECGNKI